MSKMFFGSHGTFGIRRITTIILTLVLLASYSFAVAESIILAWHCPDCGGENVSKFCTKCGAKKPDDIVCHGCGTRYPFDTDAIFCGNCGTKLQPDTETVDTSFRYEGDGFETPEDAAIQYLAGVKNQNIEQMLSAFAWETQVEHFDYKIMITRAKGTDIFYVPGMPIFDQFSRSANLELIRNYQCSYICKALNLYINDEINNAHTLSLSFLEDNVFEEYLNRCDNGRIEGLKMMRNIRLYTPDDVTDGRFSNGKNPQSFEKQSAQYGAEEIKNILIVVDIGKGSYAISPTIVRYGKKWYLVSVGSMLSNMLAIEASRQAFFELSEDLKARLNDISPYSTVANLPDDDKKITYEGSGFSTPYGAIDCYYTGLKNGNIQQMMQAFTWETQAKKYSLKDYVGMMKSINYNTPVWMQFDNAFLTEINLGSLRYYQSRKIYTAIRHFLLEDEEKAKNLLSGLRVDLHNEEEIDEFIRAFDNHKAEKLKNLTNIRLVEPASVIQNYDSDNIREKLKTYQHIFGADEIMETLAVADLDWETLIFDPLLIRYGDRWYIASVEGFAFFLLGIDTNRQALLHVKSSIESLQLLQQPFGE